MRLILLSLLTFVLLSCGEIRFEVGSDEEWVNIDGYVGQVGEWVFYPPSSMARFESSFLVNSKTGEIRACTTTAAEDLSCSVIYNQYRRYNEDNPGCSITFEECED